MTTVCCVVSATLVALSLMGVSSAADTTTHVTGDDDEFTVKLRSNWTICQGLSPKLAITPDQQKLFYTCGDQYCRCLGSYADCSNKSLTYIPTLPEGILHLDFSWKWMLHRPPIIIHDNFFTNVSKVSSIDLSGSGILHFSHGAFRPLKSLRYLFLTGNFLTYKELDLVFSIPTLEHLDIRMNGLGMMHDGMLHKYSSSRLQHLCLDGNGLGEMNMTTLQPLRNLNFVSLTGNPIVFLNSDFLPELRVLRFGQCALNTLPKTCRNGVSLFPRLRWLFLEYNRLNEYEFLPVNSTPICLPKLENLILRGNQLAGFHTGMFGSDRFPALKGLDLDAQTVDVELIETTAFNNPSLEGIVLYDNNIDFAADVVDGDLFDGCAAMRDMDFRENDFSDVTAGRMQKMLGGLRHLRYLILRSTNIKWITKGWFEGFDNLQYLDLSDNKLTVLPDGIFDGLKKLRAVSLSDNQIPVIGEKTFGTDLLRHLRLIGLGGNPLHCSCQLMWFQSWLKHNQSVFDFRHILDQLSSGEARHIDRLVCDNVPNTTVLQFHVSEQACLLGHTASSLIIFTVSFLVLTLAFTALFFRWRWHIRLLMYEAFRGRRGERMRLQRLREQRFEFDVFVGYAGEDLDWVRGHLMPELEEGLGLKLCIHERDFIPGKNIVDNIADCVADSRKVMLLFSTHFAKSNWCQFELNYCLSHVIENDDALLVAFLHDVPSRDLTPAMMAVMKTTTYIEWADEPNAKDSFWRRIYISLSEIFP